MKYFKEYEIISRTIGHNVHDATANPIYNLTSEYKNEYLRQKRIKLNVSTFDKKED